MAKKKTGRGKGQRNKGYFYRTGRGWYASEGRRMVPLMFEDGEPIKDPEASQSDLTEAYARHVVTRKDAVIAHNDVTVLDVCGAYLRHTKTHGANETFYNRSKILFDFCFGVSYKFRDKSGSGIREMSKTEMREARIHVGYGNKSTCTVTWATVDDWISAHSNWKGCRGVNIRYLLRAMNFGVERKMIDLNPIKGYRIPKDSSRITYITPEQEQEIYNQAKPALRTAISVCIRTGARCGVEFTKLTKKHIIDHGERMEWVFQPDESKNKQKRIIRITDPTTIEIVRKQSDQYPDGPIFRNLSGDPWTRDNLSKQFARLKKQLARLGTGLDQDACMYSCRHTFAKRALNGYWTGRPINIETLARLMGNSPGVCRDHYLQWSEIDNDPLWEAV